MYTIILNKPTFSQKRYESYCRFQKNIYLCIRNQEDCDCQMIFGALVQLVRIHACHAWGHGFESRTHRFSTKKKIKEPSDSQ